MAPPRAVEWPRHVSASRGDVVRLLQRWVRNAVTNAGIIGSKSAPARTMRTSASSGSRSRARCARMRSRELGGGGARLQKLHLRNARPRQHRGPARLRLEICGREPGLLGDLAHDVAREVYARPVNIVEVGEPGGEIDAPRIGGMRAHDAQDERAVAAAQGTHGEAVLDVAVGRIPVPPSQQARIVGLEIGAAEHRPGEGVPCSISTRPFHSAGLARCSPAKCASISARRSCANGHGRGAKASSSRSTGTMVISLMPRSCLRSRSRRRRRS